MLPIFVLLSTFLVVNGHGYLKDPPARNYMWKTEEFKDAPANFNMNENFCGGVGIQFGNEAKGKCGICGDAYTLKSPRPHEVGGSMYDGRIVKTYKSGEVIDVTVKLTANHMGNFDFKLCPTDKKPTKEVTQECLDENVLTDENRNTKFPVSMDHETNPFHLKVKLPDGLKCERCVLQWKYTAGNSWGCNDKKECGLGFGNQETFVNCADIEIN